MSGPLSQFSLFDLPAPQEEPAGAQPAGPEVPGAAGQSGETAPVDATETAQPVTDLPVETAANDANINTPAATQHPATAQPHQLHQPIREEDTITPEVGAPDDAPGFETAIPEAPIPGPEPLTTVHTEFIAVAAADTSIALAFSDEGPGEPEGDATKAIQSSHQDETTPETAVPGQEIIETVVAAAGSHEPAEEQATRIAAEPETAFTNAPEASAEPRPQRPILAFDIEPLGQADPQDIPREFLSGRPLVKEPKVKSTRGRKSLKATEAGPDKVLVPEDEELFKKQYYPISEVAGMFGVNISQIRYWENEFPQLKPRKNGKGDRLFRPEDVKMLVLIHDLIRRRKYTLEGAKEFLRINNDEDLRFPLIQQLQKLKGFLNELKANM